MRKLAIVTAAAAAVVLSAGAWTGLAKADGEFLVPFDPDYPTGSVYTTLRGLIITGPTDNTTRCSADLEAGQLTAVGVAQAAQVAAQLVCDIAAPGTEVAACTPVTAVNLALAIAEFQAGACVDT